MQRGAMFKVLTGVTLLAVVVVLDAAPLATLGAGQHHGLSGEGSQRPPDPWTSDPDIQEVTAMATGRLSRLLKAMTTSPDGGRKIASGRDIDSQETVDKTTSRPKEQEETIGTISRAGHSNDGKIFPEANSPAGRLKIDFAAGGAAERTTPENSSLYKRLKMMQMTTDSNTQGKLGSLATNSAIRQPKLSPITSGPIRREKIMKMLMALEEIQRAINSTLSSRLTIVPRGNGRSSGKKNKMAHTEGNVKSTTAPPVVSTGTPPRTPTDQPDPKSLPKKAHKKSLPSPQKKTNKRVCFWKYCSQN